MSRYDEILIGSHAMRYHFSDFDRVPVDTDLAVLDNEGKINGVDRMIIPLVVENSESDIASPEMLLTLKISHIFWDFHWDKHMWDIQFMLKRNVDYDFDLMLELKDFWNQLKSRKLYRSDLRLKKSEFFSNALKCPWDHDYMHTIINPNPVYKLILIDEVTPSEELFLRLSNEQKDAIIQEEVMVMAYERWPREYYKRAYYWMLKKYIRNHVPMFMLDYTLRNFIRLSNPPFNFIAKLDGSYLIPK